MKKKGSVIDILIWLVVSFTVVAFLGLYIYGFDQLTDVLVNIDDGSGLNISGAANMTFGQLRTHQTPGLHTLAFVMIFSLGLSILVSNFVVKTHPAFFIVYLMVMITAIIVSVYISNQYESLLTDATFGATFQAFKGASFIMTWLPLWTTVLGMFGALFMFVGMMRDRGTGGAVI